MNVKAGMIFTHRHWLDDDKKPLICKVFAVRGGVVYYDAAAAKKAKMKAGVEEFPKYVNEPPQ